MMHRAITESDFHEETRLEGFGSVLLTLKWRWALRRVCEYRQRISQRRALAELDERLLKDIGISRCEALAESDKPFWQA